MAHPKDYSQFINTKHNKLLIIAIPNGRVAECLCDCGKKPLKQTYLNCWPVRLWFVNHALQKRYSSTKNDTY